MYICVQFTFVIVLFIFLLQVNLFGIGERTKDVIIDESLEVTQLSSNLDGSLIPVQVTQVKITMADCEPTRQY